MMKVTGYIFTREDTFRKLVEGASEKSIKAQCTRAMNETDMAYIGIGPMPSGFIWKKVGKNSAWEYIGM